MAALVTVPIFDYGVEALRNGWSGNLKKCSHYSNRGERVRHVRKIRGVLCHRVRGHPHIRTQLLRILNENPTVEEVVDLRTRILDSSTYRIRADIQFDGSALARPNCQPLAVTHDT